MELKNVEMWEALPQQRIALLNHVQMLMLEELLLQQQIVIAG